MPIFTILGGLPGSGKSTVSARLKAEQRCFVVSTDMLRLALNAGIYPKEEAGEYGQLDPVVWELAELAVQRLLASGANVVIDATNLTRRRRQRWCDLARSASPGVHLVIHWCTGNFDSPERWANERGHSLELYRVIRAKLEADVEPPTPDEAHEVVIEVPG